jgi:hypothetical protein
LIVKIAPPCIEPTLGDILWTFIMYEKGISPIEYPKSSLKTLTIKSPTCPPAKIAIILVSCT